MALISPELQLLAVVGSQERRCSSLGNDLDISCTNVNILALRFQGAGPELWRQRRLLKAREELSSHCSTHLKCDNHT